MTPEARAREQIDNRLRQSGWTIQDLKQLNLTVASGVAVREFPTNTGPVDYALFIEGVPVGVVEAKKDEEGQALTDVETQSSRYANSQFKWVKREHKVRFAYEATGELVRFTDYADFKYRSRKVFSFHRPETLRRLFCFPREKSTRRRCGWSSRWKIWICPASRRARLMSRSRRMCWSIPV